MTQTTKIQLLYFPGCPNVTATREVLARAMKNFNFETSKIEDVNVHDPKTPDHLRNYPSPSILINGKDIEGQNPNDAAACRIYGGKGGVPEVETITQAIKEQLEE